MEMKAALHDALAKIEQQRSLIDSDQLAGSHYRPSKDELSVQTKTLIIQNTITEQPTPKAGRMLSAANLRALNDVRDDIKEVSGMDGLPRAGSALCDRCVARLQTVIDAATPADDEKPKEVVNMEQAVRSFLTEADAAKLHAVRRAVDALIAANESERRSEEYRQLLKQIG
jgi:hypothetical protein